MSAHQLDQSHHTEKSSKSRFHRVYLDDCDRGLLSLQAKMGATPCGRSFHGFKADPSCPNDSWLALSDEKLQQLAPESRLIDCGRGRFKPAESFDAIDYRRCHPSQRENPDNHKAQSAEVVIQVADANKLKWFAIHGPASDDGAA